MGEAGRLVLQKGRLLKELPQWRDDPYGIAKGPVEAEVSDYLSEYTICSLAEATGLTRATWRRVFDGLPVQYKTRVIARAMAKHLAALRDDA